MFWLTLQMKCEFLKVTENGVAVIVVLRYDNVSFKPPAIAPVLADVCKTGISTENTPSFKNCDTGTSALKA